MRWVGDEETTPRRSRVKWPDLVWAFVVLSVAIAGAAVVIGTAIGVVIKIVRWWITV